MIVTFATMIALIIVLATYELVWVLIKDITTPPILLLEIDQLLELFGLFLMLLIGIELLHMLLAYLTEDTLHIEVAISIALIALARKILIMDIKQLPGTTLFGMAVIILALAVTYYIVRDRKSRQ